MKAMRGIGAVFVAFLGVLLVVTWSLSAKTASAIEDGTAARNLTAELLAAPEVTDFAASRIQTALDEQLSDSRLGPLLSIFAQQIHDGLVQVLSSDFVTGAVATSAGKVADQLTAALTTRDRPAGAFVVALDLSERLNDRLDQIPLVGPLLPSVTLPTVEVEVIDAATIDGVRATYAAVKFASVWFLWFGLLLIGLAAWLARHRRWYAIQVAAGIALLAVGIALTLGRYGPSAVAKVMPGGPDGGAGVFVTQFVSDNAVAPIANVLFTLALTALVLAALFTLAARQLAKDPARRWWQSVKDRVSRWFGRDGAGEPASP